jgi:hypothetical protein
MKKDNQEKEKKKKKQKMDKTRKSLKWCTVQTVASRTLTYRATALRLASKCCSLTGHSGPSSPRRAYNGPFSTHQKLSWKL